MESGIRIAIHHGDALQARGDVLALKHAQGLYGVDELVVEAFEADNRKIDLPPPWGFGLERSPSRVAASDVLFVGVPPLRQFGYPEIRRFARTVLKSLAGKRPEVADVVLTLHGPGYGLDEAEAFHAEIAGIVDAIRDGDYPRNLQRISIIERNPGRAARLAEALASLFPDGTLSGALESGPAARSSAWEELRGAGYSAVTKGLVFVAMPFKPEMDDVYHYGIQSAVHAAGLLCERADQAAFTGDVLDWMRSRIRSSVLLVADLTDANPNVYLEVGFAWGIGIPTVLVVQDRAQLKFDVQGQRYFEYKRIKDLESALTKELKGLRPQSS